VTKPENSTVRRSKVRPQSKSRKTLPSGDPKFGLRARLDGAITQRGPSVGAQVRGLSPFDDHATGARRTLRELRAYFGKLIAGENEKWSTIIRRAKIKAH
jgi:hypothetical protein